MGHGDKRGEDMRPQQHTNFKNKTTMRISGNITWLVFGGLKAAIIYFTGSLALAITIIGLPWALQTFKIGLFCLWPFGANVTKTTNRMAA